MNLSNCFSPRYAEGREYIMDRSLAHRRAVQPTKHDNFESPIDFKACCCTLKKLEHLDKKAQSQGDNPQRTALSAA